MMRFVYTWNMSRIYYFMANDAVFSHSMMSMVNKGAGGETTKWNIGKSVVKYFRPDKAA